MAAAIAGVAFVALAASWAVAGHVAAKRSQEFKGPGQRNTVLSPCSVQCRIERDTDGENARGAESSGEASRAS